MDKPLPEKYRDFILKTVEHTRGQLKESGQIMPVVFLGNDAGEMDIIVMAMDDDNAKNMSSMIVRLRAMASNATMALMISESWTLPPEHMTREGYRKIQEEYGDIASSPYRIEVMLFMLETPDGHWVGMPKMSSEERTFEEEFEFQSMGENRGRFANFLPPKRT